MSSRRGNALIRFEFLEGRHSHEDSSHGHAAGASPRDVELTVVHEHGAHADHDGPHADAPHTHDSDHDQHMTHDHTTCKHGGAGHGHGHQHHHHRPKWLTAFYKKLHLDDPKLRRFVVMMVVIGSFMLLELVWGLIAHSLTLTADAMHMLSDLIALMVGFYAMLLARKERTDKSTYGFKRAEVVGALVGDFTGW